MQVREKFLEELARYFQYWVKHSSEAITQENVDLIWTDNPDSFKNIQKALAQNRITKTDVENVFSECLQGFAVSFLTIIDGGTALAQETRLHIVDENGKSLGEGLHELFIGHLLDTGRMK